jgi:hypothetical protein
MPQNLPDPSSRTASKFEVTRTYTSIKENKGRLTTESQILKEAATLTAYLSPV